MTLIEFDSLEDIISHLMNNSDYQESISQIYTRYNPILSFIKAINFQNTKRWSNLTRNIEFGIKVNIEKLQQNIDLKNILLILNLLPNFLNEQNINLESLFTNLTFGGTISYYNWIEIANNLSFSKILSKTVFLAPKIHSFLSKLQRNFEARDISLLTLKAITEIAFNTDIDEVIPITLELLGFDININMLRYIIRYNNNLTNIDEFNLFKTVLSNWKNVKTFIGSNIFNFDQFDINFLTEILEKLQSLNMKYNLNIPVIQTKDIQRLTKEDYSDFENLISHAKLIYLKRESFEENQIAKVLFILSQLTVEIENLSWILFGKAHGLDNDIIVKKLFII